MLSTSIVPWYPATPLSSSQVLLEYKCFAAMTPHAIPEWAITKRKTLTPALILKWDDTSAFVICPFPTCQGLHRDGSTCVPDGYPNSRLSHCQALKQQYQLIRPFEQDCVAEDLDLGYELDRDAAVWRTTGTPLDDFEFGDNLEAVAQDAVRSGADLLESLDGLTLDEEAYKWFISSCVTGDLHDATRCLTSSTPSGAYEEILTGTLP
jgi:hypothetical protein